MTFLESANYFMATESIENTDKGLKVRDQIAQLMTDIRNAYFDNKINYDKYRSSDDKSHDLLDDLEAAETAEDLLKIQDGYC